MSSTKERRTAYSGQYLSVSRLTVELPNNEISHREIVHVRNAVAVLPLEQNGTVHMVSQFRHAIDKQLIEIPAGLIDEGETEEEAAIRECQEETGYFPRSLFRLITYAHAEGYSTGYITLFLGMDLEYTGKLHLDAGEYLISAEMAFETLLERVKRNEIIDSKTILAALLTKDKLCNPG